MTQPSWAHHGIAALDDGDLVTFAPDNSTLRIIGSDGRLRSEHQTPVVTAHGLAVTADRRGPLLWIADTVSAPRPDGKGGYFPWYGEGHGRALAIRTDGTLVRELPQPPGYTDARFEPTAVLPLPDLGQIWVSDGYGRGLVHRYDTEGDYLGVIPASRNGAFQCPHAMLWDGDGVLIADRENNRVVRVDTDGTFVGVLAANLRRPSCLALDADTIWVGELQASIAQLDRTGLLIRRLGLDAAAPDRPGWPNALDTQGATIAPDPAPGRFNSPHAIAVDSAGTIHVVEWLIGGRHVQIDATAATSEDTTT